MGWWNHPREWDNYTSEENYKYIEEQKLYRKEQYDKFSKPYLDLENISVPIKYAIQKYKQDNESEHNFKGIKWYLFFPLPSDKWIGDYIKKNEIFKPIKIKNKWYCNKNAIDIYSFKLIKP